MKNEFGMDDFSGILSFSDLIEFDFSGSNGMSIDEVIKHLDGLQKISKNIPGLLEKLYAECDIKGVSFRLVDMRVSKIEAGSLRDWVTLALEATIVGDVDNATKEKVLADIKKMSLRTQLGILIGGIAIGFIIKGCSNSGTPVTNADGLQQQWAINIGNTFNIAPEKVTPIVKKVTKNPSAPMIQAALDFVEPAKKHGGKIIIGEQPDSQSIIPSSFIAETPECYEKKPSQPHIETVNDTPLFIRALDMDNPTRGWGAIIPAVLPGKRFNIELAEDVDRSKLLKSSITGDIEVTYQIKPDGSKKPIKILLVKVAE